MPQQRRFRGSGVSHDFEWGMWNGKLFRAEVDPGDEWDFLDT
ncbi:MAG: hypothetical protein ACYCXN_05230 [Acidimicrobiales bacterium]|jgi:hypothetical protein